MSLRITESTSTTDWLPRVSGGVPWLGIDWYVSTKVAPRERGCSGLPRPEPQLIEGCPTYMGMLEALPSRGSRMLSFAPSFVEQALLNQKIRKSRQTESEGLTIGRPLGIAPTPLSLAYTPEVLHMLMPGAPIGCPATVGDSLMEEGRRLRRDFPDAFVCYLILPEGRRRVGFAHELIPLCDIGVIVVDNTPTAIGDLADAFSEEGSVDLGAEG